MKTPYAFLWLFGLIVTGGSNHASGYSFTTFQDPQGDRTEVRGISGSTVIGSYVDGDGRDHGFSYNGSSYTTVDSPAGGRNYLNGISGATVVGNVYYGIDGVTYGSHGFIYNGSTFTSLQVPGAAQTFAQGISGSTVVGYSQDKVEIGAVQDNPSHGFIYNGSTYTTLNFPGADATELLDISGGIIGGTYDIAGNPHPFTYDGSAFTTLDFPSYAALPNATITGISGHTVVGYNQPGPGIGFSGFVYDGSVLTTLSLPGAAWTLPMGISGTTVFGTASTSLPYGPGFIAQAPEPTSAIMVGIAGLGVLLTRRPKSDEGDPDREKHGSTLLDSTSRHRAAA